MDKDRDPGSEDDVHNSLSSTCEKVSIKIPPFWPDRPEIWFYSIEAQFTPNKTTVDETKFNYLVSQLDPEIIENIWDIIQSGTDQKYARAKEKLISIFKESQEKKLKRLLTGMELGDLRPSQLLRKMQTLAGTNMSNNLLRTLWFEKLPNTVKNILIISEKSLDKVAIMADKIVEMNSNTELCYVKQPEGSGTVNRDETIIKMYSKFDALEKRIAQMDMRSKLKPRDNRRRCRSRSRYDPKGMIPEATQPFNGINGFKRNFRCGGL